MSDQATTLKGKLKVGLTYIGAAALAILGGVNLSGNLNFEERVRDVVNGQAVTRQVQTGATININGTRVKFVDTIPLTMTGGNTNYDLASLDPADYFTGSGYLTMVSLQWVRAPAGGTSDVAFASGLKAATGTVVLNNATNGTGSSTWMDPSSGVRWNGGTRLKVGSLTNPTASGSGYLLIEGYEDLAE